MPAVDMPVEELFKYKGSSPCPADFDKYWDDALSEMNAINPEVEFVKKDFPSKVCDMFDLFYTGTKNARIHAKVAIPKNQDGKMPAVLCFHGLSGHADTWSDLLKYASQGYVVAAMDARGQGGLSEDVGGVKGSTWPSPFMRGIEGDKHDLLMRDVYLDTALLAKCIMSLDYVDETRVATQGGSQGGALSIVCASLVPEIKKCAPWCPYLSDFKHVYDIGLNKDAYEGLQYYFRIIDPAHERETEIFEKLGYIDIQNFAKRLKAELLLQVGLVDTICPPSTQFAMYNKVTAKKNAILYPEYAHEIPPEGFDRIIEFFADL